MNHLTRRSSSLRPMSQINVVPYIDVMLVLLVIFMITAPMMNPGKIDLPSVGKALAPPVAPLEVIVHRDTSLGLHDRSRAGGEFDVSRDELIAYLKSHRVREIDQPVVISADKRVRYEEVIKVMDLLQQQEVRRVGLLVQTR